jgi:hypothetical protein
MANLDQSEAPRKSLTNRAVTAGAYAAGAGIALGLISYVTGLSETMMKNSALNWLNNLILFGIIFYFIYKAAQQYRNLDNDGFLSVGQGIGIGTLAGLASGVITAIWMMIFMGVIAPDMMDKIKEITMQQMQEKGQTEEQIEQAMEFSAFFFSPVFFAIVTLFFSIFIGFLAGLVSGLMLKKERPLA